MKGLDSVNHVSTEVHLHIQLIYESRIFWAILLQLKLIYGQSLQRISWCSFRAKGLATNKQQNASSILMIKKCKSDTKNTIAHFTLKFECNTEKSTHTHKRSPEEEQNI